MKNYDEQELYFDELYSYSNKLPSRLFEINYDEIDKFVETCNMPVKLKTCNKSVTCLAWHTPSFKGKWQQKFLSSHLKETAKQYIGLLQNFYICLIW